MVKGKAALATLGIAILASTGCNVLGGSSSTDSNYAPGLSAIAVADLGLTSGTSGGVPYFSSSSTLASSALLSQYQVVLGGGAGQGPSVVSSLGATGQVLTSNGLGLAPTWQNAGPWTSNSTSLYYNLGNVGIGTATPGVALDVNGGVRAGNSTGVTACGSGSSNGEGTQRYNYTTHYMEYCNGTAWIALVPPPTAATVSTPSTTACNQIAFLAASLKLNGGDTVQATASVYKTGATGIGLCILDPSTNKGLSIIEQGDGNIVYYSSNGAAQTALGATSTVSASTGWFKADITVSIDSAGNALLGGAIMNATALKNVSPGFTLTPGDTYNVYVIDSGNSSSDIGNVYVSKQVLSL